MVAFEMLDPVEVEVVEADHGEALVLAERSGLTAYDANCGSRAGSVSNCHGGQAGRRPWRPIDGVRGAVGQSPAGVEPPGV